MVQIITDSAADFEPWEYEEMNVRCIPLCVSIGNTEYEENVNITKDMFYQLLADCKDFPRTSQAAPYTVECIFREAKDTGDEAVVIAVSSKLSGFYQNLLMVKNMMKYSACHIIDSKNASGGNRLLVEHAVKLRDEGKSAREIVAEIEMLRSKITLFACMHTLEYLHRGGRVSNTAYAVGSIAHIKPIITLNEDGSVGLPAKTMGMRKGVAFLCKKILQSVPDEKYPIYVMYTADKTNGLLLAKKLAECGYIVPDERIINVGAAIGSHIGPNACGLVYIRK